MPVCGNYLFFELPKKIVLNPKDGLCALAAARCFSSPALLLLRYLANLARAFME